MFSYVHQYTPSCESGGFWGGKLNIRVRDLAKISAFWPVSPVARFYCSLRLREVGCYINREDVGCSTLSS